MLGGGNTVRDGVQATDGGCGALLQVEIECPGTVNGVRGGDGYRFDGSPSIDAA